MKRVFLALLLTLILVGCNGPIPNIPLSEGPYVNENYGYTITPPNGWILAEAAQGAAVTFVSTDGMPQIILAVVDTDIALLDVVEEEKERLADANIMVGAILGQESPLQINTLSAYSMEYTYKLGYNLKAKEIIIVQNNYFYSLTFQDKVENYNANYHFFEDALSTFELI